MSAPLWVAELADRYWSAAGAREPFPRSLRDAAFALPFSVVRIEKLGVSAMRARLERIGIDCGMNVSERPLRACLVAFRGHGTAFIDAADSEDERRFSLAHELAHFLRDYLQPRETAARKLGPEVLDVLDGLRPATTTERFHALLRQAKIGVHVHLMDRREHRPDIRIAEDGADRLAFELLAPVEEVRAMLKECTARAATAALRDTFGLPTLQAETYAALLFPAPRMDPLLAGLRLVPSGAGT